MTTLDCSVCHPECHTECCPKTGRCGVSRCPNQRRDDHRAPAVTDNLAFLGTWPK